LVALVTVGVEELAVWVDAGSAFAIAPQIPQATRAKRIVPQPMLH